MKEHEFRSDESAVKSLDAFLNTDAGRKFLSVLDDESVLEKMSSVEHQEPGNVRDLALAEQGSASNLLGRMVGYHLCIKVIKRCRSIVQKQKPDSMSKASEVSRALKKTSNK